MSENENLEDENRDQTPEDSENETQEQ